MLLARRGADGRLASSKRVVTGVAARHEQPRAESLAFSRATAEVGGIATGMTASGTNAKASRLLGILLVAAIGWSRVEIIHRIMHPNTWIYIATLRRLTLVKQAKR